GLIEAFSTTCPQCSGRGILLHADPVDSAPAAGRKSESGGKRGRRSKKSRSDEPAVAKVPAHAPGEHPMFKAMAAANGRHDDETEDSELSEDLDAAVGEDQPVEEQVAREVAEEDLEDADFEDTDEDDEVELDDDEDLDDEDLDDDDDEDLDLDDDLEVEDSDGSKDAGSEGFEDGGSDSDAAGEATGESAFSVVTASDAAQPRRRRAAARPAGPPVHED
ncbi:MAG: ribonuclease E/G, partial [Mycobacterium sp.]